YRIFVSFFFQAEDGIRDFHVTGVQTCALPISSNATSAASIPSSEVPDMSPITRTATRSPGPEVADDARDHAVRRRETLDRLGPIDRKSTRLNSSHVKISYAVFCLKKKIH